MKQSNRRKKERIFSLFSQNLEWVKQHPSISFEPDFSMGYICPLCFDLFTKQDLESTSKNQLTLEDIPPASLGGKPLALTCKICNSKSGHNLDAHLLKNLLEMDASSFLPNSRSRVKFELNGNKMNGMLEVNEKGELKFNLQSENSHPKQSKQFIKDLVPPRTIQIPSIFNDFTSEKFSTPPFNLSFHKTSNERRAEIALLRIAYLLLFSTLGNCIFINGGLYKVREQILNPDEDLIPKVFWIKYDFPEHVEGINIITLPKELRCFLVVFRIFTKSMGRQYSIILPGPSDPGLKVYDFVRDNLSIGDGSAFQKITLETIPKRDYLRLEREAFAGTWFWQEFTKDSYQPNYAPT